MRSGTVVLVPTAHRIQGTLRENQSVLLWMYTVYDPDHMVKTFGHTANSMRPEDQNYGAEIALLTELSEADPKNS